MSLKRCARALVLVAGLPLAANVLVAGPAAAACASNPGTNPITIHPGPPFTNPIVIPGMQGGTTTVCADVTGNPNPQVDQDVTVDVQPTGCGVPCFVVEWDGVTAQAVTVSVWFTAASSDFAFQRTIPAGSYGSLCVNSGQPCP